MASLDKFYTLPTVAKGCIDRVGTFFPWTEWDWIIEPSAGNGSFFHQLPSEARCIGIDIAPEHPTIHQQDFLTFVPPELPLQPRQSTQPPQPPQPPQRSPRILVIGNPPFGRVSSLAIKFFNHAAQWASVIAYIVPRTFRRVSVQNKLDPHFHLVHDEIIPTTPCAFTPPMMAKCCFQIWVRQEGPPRPRVTLATTHPDWEFLPLGPNDATGQPTPPEVADFAIRAYGGKCGELQTTRLDALRPKSWHWIRATTTVASRTLQDRFASLDYSVSLDTARQNSIGRGELVQLYVEKYGSDETP